jgi:hypothetical protein
MQEGVAASRLGRRRADHTHQPGKEPRRCASRCARSSRLNERSPKAARWRVAIAAVDTSYTGRCTSVCPARTRYVRLANRHRDRLGERDVAGGPEATAPWLRPGRCLDATNRGRLLRSIEHHGYDCVISGLEWRLHGPRRLATREPLRCEIGLLVDDDRRIDVLA